MPLDCDELDRRAAALSGLQRPCRLCPRRCGVDRPDEAGFCQQRGISVAAVCAHRGEEPPLSGRGGAGTVFLTGCTMRCAFCQNHQISQAPVAEARGTSVEELASRFLDLQRAGCHNIEWVSPTPHLPGLVAALAAARRRGLTLPVVYNTSGFERVEILRLLDGVVDIYLPDAKYGRPDPAEKLSETAAYVEANRRALREMWRQAGPLLVDDEGVARRGLIVRHLVLPGLLSNTRDVLAWLAAEIGPRLCVSVMAQYYPAHRAAPGIPAFPALSRRLTRREHGLAVSALLSAGLHEGYVQELESWRRWQPDFSRDRPFDEAT